jgi:hypothetical protein
MNNYLKDNWFKIGILFVLVFVGASISYYFLFHLGGKNTESKPSYSFRKIQDTEVLAVVPEGYHLAQVADGMNAINYIVAHLEHGEDKQVVVLLEWSKPQNALADHNPAMIKVLKYNHESDKWQEHAKRALGVHTNIRFNFKLLNIQGDSTDKIALFPHFYGLYDMTFDASGNPIAVKPQASMHQSVIILEMRNGELSDMIGYGFKAPQFDNITEAGGADNVAIFDGALYFADYIKSPGAKWSGCYKLHYKRYVYRKDAAVFFEKHGAFVFLDEFTTKHNYTGGQPDPTNPAETHNRVKDCTFIIYAGSAVLEESFPPPFLQTPSDSNILRVKEE